MAVNLLPICGLEQTLFSTVVNLCGTVFQEADDLSATRILFPSEIVEIVLLLPSGMPLPLFLTLNVFVVSKITSLKRMLLDGSAGLALLPIQLKTHPLSMLLVWYAASLALVLCIIPASLWSMPTLIFLFM